MDKENLSMVTMGSLFVIAQILALLLAIPSKSMGLQAFEDPNDPVNPLYYIVMLLVLTGGLLLLIKIKKEKAIKYLLMFAFIMIMYVVFSVLIAQAWGPLWEAGLSSAPDEVIWPVYLLFFFLPYVLPIAIMYWMHRNPEWYIVDTIGLLVAAGATAILGISLHILPLLVLLTALAIYDAISVYKTQHMITLADSVVSFRLPVLLVVPKAEDYSLKEQKRLRDQIDKGEERGAMFMGLGDLVIPGALVVSAFTFLYPVMSGFLVAIGTMIGALCGYSALMWYVAKGNPQAGLPLLNSGAIFGYLASYLVVYQNLGFGIIWWW